jgi:hypothetical protein
MDVPVGEAAGASGGRARLWSVLTGLVACLVPVGVVLVLVLVQDTPVGQLWGAPPPLFTRRTLTTLDYYFLGLVGLGLLFLEGAILALRRSRYPRTDGAGAALVGTLLCALGGVVLFVRLWAVVHG